MFRGKDRRLRVFAGTLFGVLAFTTTVARYIFFHGNPAWMGRSYLSYRARTAAQFS